MKIYTTEEITKKMNKKLIIKKAFKAIVYPVIILILICDIILLIQKIISPNQIASLFGYKAFVISSGSMEPTLNTGDIVITKQIKQDQIQKQDIITFVKDEYTITHRIVDIVEENGNTYYQTKGDNNNTSDADLVKYEEIEGVYVFKINSIGNIVVYAQNTTAVLIIIICVIYIMYRISSRKDDRKLARHEKRKEYEEKNNKQ